MWVDGHFVRAASTLRRRTGPYGVTRHEPDRAYQGYTLFSPAWGHLAVLIDMDGLVVHTWPVRRSNLAELLPDGHLFTHNVGHRLEELRPDGSTAWRWQSDEPLDLATHHDFFVGDDTVWTLAKRQEPVIRGFYEPGLAPEHMRGDLILGIHRGGEVIERFALSDHLEELASLAGLRFPLRYRRRWIDGTVEPYGPADWAHANSLEVLRPTPLGERDERFRAGNLLFSLRQLDLIGVLDPRQRAVVWAWGLGELDAQHHPTQLDDGRLLVFDNGSCRGYSTVRELDPASGRTVWQYSDPQTFFSAKRGSNQRLPNGNTLICESDRGRLFEVTPGKEVVWEYWSPFLAQGPRHLGRRIYRASRYSATQVAPLLAARDDRVAGHKLPDGTKITRLPELIEHYRRGWA